MPEPASEVPPAAQLVPGAEAIAEPSAARALGTGTWVVVPTYNEAENLAEISAAILARLPGATLLVVDDRSPDGTGDIADELAARDPRIRVCHRRRKEGLGPAYLEGFDEALAAGASVVVQMDADWQHDPAALPALLSPLEAGTADLVIGSRYTQGGRVTDWGLGRLALSRGASLYARLVLGVPVHDMTAGFKAWRASTLRSIPFAGVHSGGYVFQIEMTHKARRSGARLVEVPITFRDRNVGASKMSRRIVAEALVVVVQLRWEESSLRRLARRGLRAQTAASRASGHAAAGQPTPSLDDEARSDAESRG